MENDKTTGAGELTIGERFFAKQRFLICQKTSLARALFALAVGRQVSVERFSDGKLGACAGTKIDLSEGVSACYDLESDTNTIWLSVAAPDSDKAIEWLDTVVSVTEQSDPAIGRLVDPFGEAIDDQFARDVDAFVGCSEKNRSFLRELFLERIPDGDVEHASVLLCGAPGCGKTGLARALAKEATAREMTVVWCAPDQTISAEAVRSAFGMAGNLAPSIVVFDDVGTASNDSPGILALSSFLSFGVRGVGVLIPSRIAGSSLENKVSKIVEMKQATPLQNVEIAKRVVGDVDEKLTKELSSRNDVSTRDALWTAILSPRRREPVPVVSESIDSRSSAVRQIPLMEGATPGTVRTILVSAARFPDDVTDSSVIGFEDFSSDKWSGVKTRLIKYRAKRRVARVTRVVKSLEGVGIEAEKIRAAIRLLRVPGVTLGELSSVLAD